VTALGHFLTIDPDECRRLLGDSTVGRVCWNSSAGLQVLPGNYLVAGGQIVFHVARGTVLEELTQPVDVAFQVDDLDQDTATGWAVLVRGRTAPYAGDPDAVATRSWAPGDRDLLVAIDPTQWSGRAVSAQE